MSGWIKIHRKIMDNFLWADPRKLQWWMIILFETSYKDKKLLVGNDVVDLVPGQCDNTIDQWTELFGCSTKTVYPFFELLEKEEMITREMVGNGRAKRTILTVLNYTEYQESTTQTTTQVQPELQPELQHKLQRHKKEEKEKKVNNNRVAKKPTARNEESNAIWYELVNLWITEEDPNILNGPTRKRYFDIMTIEQQQALLDTIKGFGKHVKFLKKTWISVTFKNHNMNEIFLLNEIAREKKAIEKRVGNDSQTYIDGEEDYVGAAAKRGIKTIRYE